MVEWQGASACITPRSLAVCDWEGTACVIAQDVVSSDFHVRFRSGPEHPVIEKLLCCSPYNGLKLSELFEAVSTPVGNALFAGVQSS